MCGPEFSDLEVTIWQTYQADGVVVLGIDRGESAAIAADFADQFGVTFPILADPAGTSATYVDYLIHNCASPFPRDFIIDPDGRVAYRSCDYDPLLMTGVIDDLLSSLDVEGPVVDERSVTRRAVPNPFTQRVSVVLDGVTGPPRSVQVLDATGRVVRSTVPGLGGRFDWDARNDRGDRVAPGVYFVRGSPGVRAVRVVLAE